MKQLKILIILVFMLTGKTAFASNVRPKIDKINNSDNSYFARQNIKVENKRMTPEALWGMGRIGSFDISPDGNHIVYTVAYYSIPEDKSNREVFVIDTNGKNNKQITHSIYQESDVKWIKNGTKIAFLSNDDGLNQLYEMNPDGSGRCKISNFDRDLEGFLFSPDEKKVIFISEINIIKTTADKYPDLPKASGIIINDLMYKHWDDWVTTAPHPFIANYDGQKLSNITDIMQGELYECPMKPFGGIEQIAWNTTSDKIAYTCRKLTGKEYALSTNSDIYEYNITAKQTKNLTKGMMGYDTNPQYSPDGKYIAWQSMEHDGYESDQNRLFIMDLKSGEKSFISRNYPSNVDAFIWNINSKEIYFTGVWHGEEHVYCINTKKGDYRQITSGMYDYDAVTIKNNQLYAKRHSMSNGDEIFKINPRNSNVFQLTFENKHIYDQIEMGKVEPRWITTNDGQSMLTWIIYPPHFDPNKKYPTLLYCEGGPQSPVSQFWSYRWNFQIMAANDYIIVAPNRRGLPGFGNEWNEEISGDYGGKCMEDYLKAIDEVSKEKYVDKEHLGCVGASFGGFSVYWLAGHHNKRFKAFIAHDGIFNLEMQALETEEKWFVNWDLGGMYWDKKNNVAQCSYATSPHKFIDKWDTPILCIHGEKDYRILASQAMSAFDAAVLRGIPAELLLYPDENHWVLKPQNGILWQRTFFEWLNRWLKCK